MLRRKTATYALLAMYEIARQQKGAKDPVGVRAGDISTRYRLPRAYAAKILSQLAGAGVLHSDRGPRGGFKLIKPIDEISLYEVFEAVSAVSFKATGASVVKGLPPTVQTAINKAWGQSADLLKDLYVKTTIGDILGKEV
jgi:Rrf2 family protein